MHESEQQSAIWYRLHEHQEIEPEPHGYVRVSVHVKCDYVRDLVLSAFQTHPIGYDLTTDRPDIRPHVHLMVGTGSVMIWPIPTSHFRFCSGMSMKIWTGPKC